jgi:hypothetical protein
MDLYVNILMKRYASDIFAKISQLSFYFGNKDYVRNYKFKKYFFKFDGLYLRHWDGNEIAVISIGLQSLQRL